MTVKQLEAEVSKVRQFVKTRTRLWIIVAAVGVILLTVLFITLTRKARTNDAYENQIRTLDSVVKYQADKIETLSRYAELLDSSLADLERQYQSNRPRETKIITRYEKIPIDVRAMDREQLRREVAGY